MKKRHIVITAVVTFYVTALLFLIVGMKFFGGSLMLNNGFGSKLGRIEALLEDNFIFDYNKDKAQESALEGYLKGVGDVYTEYISKAEYSGYQANTEGKYRGIGVVVSLYDDDATVITVNPETPAQKAGILPGDIIKNVNGLDINADSYNDAISIIRGNDKRGEDDNLSIVVLRDGNEISLNILREEVESVTVTDKIIDGNIGYIRISSFDGTTGEQFDKAIEKLHLNEVKALIFDVRNNPGGTLEAVLKVTDRVLEEGTILTIKNKSGKEEVYKADDDKWTNLPMYVIANGNSASAAEVFTAALKENGACKVVGETTFGKGIVQSIYDFGDETAVKLTTAKYYTPDGSCIHNIGVKPDFEVALDERYKDVSLSDIPYNEDHQLKKAVELAKEN